MTKPEIQLEEYINMMRQSFIWIERHSKNYPHMARLLQAWWSNEMTEAIQNVTYRTWEITDRSRRLGRPWTSLPDIREEARHTTFPEGQQELTDEESQDGGSDWFQCHLAQLMAED